jgi:hypothetical protein
MRKKSQLLVGVVLAVSSCLTIVSPADASFVRTCRLKVRVLTVFDLMDQTDLPHFVASVSVLQAKVGGRADASCKSFVKSQQTIDLRDVQTNPSEDASALVGSIRYFLRFEKDGGGTTPLRLETWTQITKKAFDAK